MEFNKNSDIPDLGQAWLNESSANSIISLAHTADKNRVTCDSGKEREFVVYHLNKDI
jgi:hypothetical protein